MIKDNSYSIVRSMQAFFSGTMLSRITGLIRDMSMAAAFGTDPAVAAFMVAFRLSNLLRRVLGEGSMQAVFIPHFEALRAESPKRAASFYRDLSTSLSIILLLIIIFVECFLYGAKQLLFSEGGQGEIITLVAIIFPSTLFICHFGLNFSLLQCEGKYFVSAVAPIAFNLVWIGAIYFIGNEPVNQAMQKLAFFIFVGYGMQYLMTLPHVAQFTFKHLSLQRWWGVIFSDDVKKLGKPLLLGIIGVGAVQVNSALDALFARWGEGEGPAYLWYAIRIQQLPLSLFGLAISLAVMPPLARALQEEDRAAFSRYLDLASQKLIAVMIPSTFGIILLGFPGVTLLFVRGEFNEVSALETSACLTAYALGILPISLVSIYSSAHYSQKNFSLPAGISVLTVLINVFLNSLFIFYFQMGALSVALVTSLGALFNALCLYFTLLEIFPYKYFGKVFLLSAISALPILFYWGQEGLFAFHDGFRDQLIHFLKVFFAYLGSIVLFDKLAGLGVVKSVFNRLNQDV